VIRGKNYIACNVNMELKILNPNGDNVVANNLINVNFFSFFFKTWEN
jgi:hypothetical protein